MKNKNFWIWYIPLLLIMCGVVYFKLVDVNKHSAPLKLDNLSNEYYVLVKHPDYTIYTKYQVDYYNNESLSNLLQNKISIDDIIKEMSYVDSLNDGGSAIYHSDNKRLSKTEFYIIKCNTLEGNKDIYITDSNEYLCR